MLTERLQDVESQVVRSAIELGAFSEPGACQVSPAHATIARVDANARESLSLQGAQETADVARIEAEAGSKRPDLGALGSDFPQQPSLAERPCSAEEPVVQCTNAFGDCAVELSNLLDRERVHSLTIVREFALTALLATCRRSHLAHYHDGIDTRAVESRQRARHERQPQAPAAPMAGPIPVEATPRAITSRMADAGVAPGAIPRAAR